MVSESDLLAIHLYSFSMGGLDRLTGSPADGWWHDSPDRFVIHDDQFVRPLIATPWWPRRWEVMSDALVPADSREFKVILIISLLIKALGQLFQTTRRKVPFN